MPNTNLKTAITPNVTTGEIADTIIVHREVNELSRATPLLDVTSFLINGWTATFFYIERVRDRVCIYHKGLNGTNATSSRMMDFSGAGGIGTGFSPFDFFESPISRHGTSIFEGRISAGLTGGITGVIGQNFGTGAAREFQWRTRASFPTSYPGSVVA